MKCEYGFCSVCDKVIARTCDSCPAKTPTNEYTEVEVTWSNGAKMKIGVCLDCAKSHAWMSPKVKEGITQAHWDYWDKKGAKYDKEVVVV